MAKSVINTGTVANDGTGDTLRAAGIKINDNFSEIYTALGDGSAISLTATAAELNTLDGITASTTELNYVDGVTSAIQTQLNSKAATASLATVATSGAYSDLSGTPTPITTQLTLTASTSAPTVSAGTFAVADGVSWDPDSKAGSVPYPVFYDGTSWNALY